PVSPSLVAYSARISFLAAVSSGTCLLKDWHESGLMPRMRGIRTRQPHEGAATLPLTRLVAGQRFTLPRTAMRSSPSVSGASRRLLQRRGLPGDRGIPGGYGVRRGLSGGSGRPVAGRVGVHHMRADLPAAVRD